MCIVRIWSAMHWKHRRHVTKPGRVRKREPLTTRLSNRSTVENVTALWVGRPRGTSLSLFMHVLFSSWVSLEFKTHFWRKKLMLGWALLYVYAGKSLVGHAGLSSAHPLFVHRASGSRGRWSAASYKVHVVCERRPHRSIQILCWVCRNWSFL